VALEAMARARPVVASRIGGIPEIVKDGNTGLLVSPRNVDELAEKLDALWADSDSCDRMGAAGRAKALTDYSEETFYLRLMSLYGQVCQDRTPTVQMNNAKAAPKVRDDSMTCTRQRI
ncbi:glycosyltransferase family 4 protein, partial [Candidatus Bathyarchaeota archaeon]|nr:glycosyltransferase family 4 protein [Candidatus Bathyarchaeota archaeon]